MIDADASGVAVVLERVRPRCGWVEYATVTSVMRHRTPTTTAAHGQRLPAGLADDTSASTSGRLRLLCLGSLGGIRAHFRDSLDAEEPEDCDRRRLLGGDGGARTQTSKLLCAKSRRTYFPHRSLRSSWWRTASAAAPPPACTLRKAGRSGGNQRHGGHVQ